IDRLGTGRDAAVCGNDGRSQTGGARGPHRWSRPFNAPLNVISVAEDRAERNRKRLAIGESIQVYGREAVVSPARIEVLDENNGVVRVGRGQPVGYEAAGEHHSVARVGDRGAVNVKISNGLANRRAGA